MSFSPLDVFPLPPAPCFKFCVFADSLQLTDALVLLEPSSIGLYATLRWSALVDCVLRVLSSSVTARREAAHVCARPGTVHYVEARLRQQLERNVPLFFSSHVRTQVRRSMVRLRGSAAVFSSFFETG